MARRSDTRKSIQAKRDYAFLKPKPKDSMANDIFLYNVHSLHNYCNYQMKGNRELYFQPELNC